MLAAVHLVVAVVLAATWAVPWLTGPDLEDRLVALDPERSAQDVQQALDALRPGGALLDEDRTRVASFLALVCQGAGLELVDLTWEEGPPEPERVPVTAVAAIAGDAFGVPAFLDGLHRQRATVGLLAVDLDLLPGGAATGVVRLGMHRPVEVDPGWVFERLEQDAPTATAAAPALEGAASLAAWRRFAALDQAARVDAREARRQAAVQLPAALVALRRTGGSLHWTPAEGATTSARKRPPSPAP